MRQFLLAFDQLLNTSVWLKSEGFGSRPSPYPSAYGWLEEVRISKIERLDEWVKAEYHSLFATLQTVGAEARNNRGNAIFLGCNF